MHTYELEHVRLIRDVIRCVEPDDGRRQRPHSERARLQRRDCPCPTFEYKETEKESRKCTNEDVLASVRWFFLFFIPTARGILTIRCVIVYPLRELEGEEVLDGVEERR